MEIYKAIEDTLTVLGFTDLYVGKGIGPIGSKVYVYGYSDGIPFYFCSMDTNDDVIDEAIKAMTERRRRWRANE